MGDWSYESNVEDLGQPVISSTPRKNTRTETLFNDSISFNVTRDVTFSKLTAGPSKSKSSFKKPRAPRNKIKPTITCTYCGKGYVATASYKNHVMSHTLQDAASRYPQKDVILQNGLSIGAEALAAVAVSPSCGDRGVQFFQFVAQMQESNQEVWEKFLFKLCDLLLDPILNQKYLLPSKLLSALIDQSHIICNRSEHRQLLLSLLNVSNAFDESLWAPFLLQFSLDFSKCVLKFIIQSVCGYQQFVKQSLVKELSQDERETVYYIGGNIMRGYFRLAHRYCNNEKWCTLKDILQKYVITDQPVADSAWTMERDRGGLIYITKECQEFFLGLTSIVYSMEERDGSISYGKVIKAVSSSDLAVKWDQMFVGCISHEISVNLMNDVLEGFSKVCGLGFAKRRFNNLRKGPVVSMPTRHLVATRKRR